MRQPEPPDVIEELRTLLSFAVPLRSADLAYKLKSWGYSRAQAIAWLTSEAKRAGVSLGGRGDALQFSDRTPRTGRARDTVVRTADDFVSGIAAAGLLAQLEGRGGVTVFGDYYGAPSVPSGTEPPEPAEQSTPPNDGNHEK
ncbi:hypothetical protein AQJ46_42120 [Streptomyces canus]|uniref:Uncharacterized protein n=1 Tax=Streptomyces canus TaxID=58343 RepID=A0A101RNG1_9ACTN|nr:hypothetical protein [Streptomyces canus]KUN58872.1 hypothetical protein AQJ46_42120 [Streptomyces canus]